MDDELAAIASVFRTCANVLRRRADGKGLDGAANLLLGAAYEADSAATLIDRALTKKHNEIAPPTTRAVSENQ